jgi:hypothetical protein
MNKAPNKLHGIVFSNINLDVSDSKYWLVEINFLEVEFTFRNRYFSRSLFCLSFSRDEIVFDCLFIRLLQ